MYHCYIGSHYLKNKKNVLGMKIYCHSSADQHISVELTVSRPTLTLYL